MLANALSERVGCGQDCSGSGDQRTGVAGNTLHHLQISTQGKQSYLLPRWQLLQSLDHLQSRPLLVFGTSVQHVEQQNIDRTFRRIDGEVRVLTRWKRGRS